MTIHDFKKENIIDLRTSIKYQRFHFNGSRNIDYINLLSNPSEYLKRNEEYLLVCDKGIQSMDVSNILKKRGYHTYSLEGGIEKIIKK